MPRRPLLDRLFLPRVARAIRFALVAGLGVTIVGGGSYLVTERAKLMRERDAACQEAYRRAVPAPMRGRLVQPADACAWLRLEQAAPVRVYTRMTP